MTITILSKHNTTTPFRDVREAKQMIITSLLEFLDDSSSERRLLYDLAMTATGTYNFRSYDRVDRGIIQQECHFTKRLIWMKLLWLPLSDFNGPLKPHGKFLIGDQYQRNLTHNTSCYIEVYGFNDHVPVLSYPYMMVCGSNPEEVKIVADLVEEVLHNHQQGCKLGCKFFN